ncbi:unnamed protein product [Amoebophrya sp. A25]|nr:unnamed protein product [Amoebophrya sp. A25]|eukprot:GSA25T00009679001.1
MFYPEKTSPVTVSGSGVSGSAASMSKSSAVFRTEVASLVQEEMKKLMKPLEDELANERQMRKEAQAALQDALSKGK